MKIFEGIKNGVIISFILWIIVLLAVVLAEEPLIEKVNSDEIRVTESVKTIMNLKAIKLELDKTRMEKEQFEKQVPLARARLETKIAKLESLITRSETILKIEEPKKENL